MEVLQAIKTKRAIRQFSTQPVTRDTVRKILDAGRRAQSSKNTQPWSFVVITQHDTLVELARCGRYAGHLAGAAFAVVLVSDTDWAFDTGQAAAYLQLAAWALGIGSCLAYLGEAERAKALLGVPAEKHLEIAISFGYPAEPPPAGLRPGGRKALDEVVHWETYK